MESVTEFMRKFFVSAEIATKLEELGYKEPCHAFYIEGDTNEKVIFTEYGGEMLVYNNVKTRSGKKLIPAPYIVQVVDWLREKHHLHLIINWYQGYYLWQIKLLDADLSDRNSIRSYTSSARENDYYVQMELGIQAALKLIK